MSDNVIPLKTHTDPQEAAADWIARLDRGLTGHEEHQLQQWLARDARHREALLAVAELWDKMDDLSRLSALFDKPRPQPRARRWQTPAAIAACLGLLVVALTVWLQKPADTPPPMASHFETAVGEQVVVNLADDSKLTLNTDTRVSVDYSDQARLLTLSRGEIHVDVSHDPDRPLSVIAGDKIVQAVGTAFNVRLRDKREVDLTVTEGRVRVKDQLPTTKAHDLAQKRLAQTSSREFQHGEKVRLGPARWQLQQLDDNQMEESLSWRRGKLVFRGEPLSEVLAEISRYTQTRFDLADKELAEIRIAGLFRTGDVEQLLSSLEQNFGIDTKRLGPKRVRLARRTNNTATTP